MIGDPALWPSRFAATMTPALHPPHPAALHCLSNLPWLQFMCAATVDDSLPFILNILLACCASLAGVAIVLCLTQARAPGVHDCEGSHYTLPSDPDANV